MSAGELLPLVVVFDLDDTLYPEHAYVRSGLRAAARWAVEEEGLPDLAEAMLAEFAAGRRGDIFDRALAAHGLPAAAGLIGRLLAAYRQHPPAIDLYEDAQWALAHFEREGPLALLTDGYHEVQARKVAALAIAPRFRRIVYTDALGGPATWKPSPAGFLDIARALPARRHAYVGDNLAKDFVAPNALGWRTVQICRPGAEHAKRAAAAGGEPERQVTSLRDLPAALA